MSSEHNSWVRDALIYHIFPLGLCGAPASSEPKQPSRSRIKALLDWKAQAASLGCNTLLLGPFWESVSHGYDITDYRTVDRRLGTKDDLASVLSEWKNQGFRLVFDGVFNHCGRGFPPFVDLCQKGESSPYVDWFDGVDFSKRSPYGDPFSYKGWSGHFNLVKFRLSNPALREYLFSSIASWIDDYDIDGLRIDAADVIDKDFLRDLVRFCRSKKHDFWFVGEVVHGNYRDWTDTGLDSITNYELYKGLWSSHHDGNYFEIAWSLNRQFGEGGVYNGLRLYNFAENHDVNRVASLVNEAHLYPLHLLLFTIPGVPSLYYGEEAAWKGVKANGSDAPLRPALQPDDLKEGSQPDLAHAIRHFHELRQKVPALKGLNYQAAHVASHQFAFWRRDNQGHRALVAINAETERKEIIVEAPQGTVWEDALNGGTWHSDGRLHLELDPMWGRVLHPVSQNGF